MVRQRSVVLPLPSFHMLDGLGKYITPSKTEPESLVIGDLIVFFQEQRAQPLQLILDDASAGDA